MWWFKALLFFVLSPGVLLTIPAGPSGRYIMSGETSVAAAAVHSIVFIAVMYLLWPIAKKMF